MLFPVCLPAAEKTIGVFSFCPESQNHLHPMSSGILATASHILSSESGRRVPRWRGENEKRAVGGETLGRGTYSSSRVLTQHKVSSE